MKDYYREKLTTKDKRDFLKALLDQIPAVIHINDIRDYNNMIVKWINNSVKTISGYSPENVIDNPEFVKDLMNVENMVKYTSIIEPVLEDASNKFVTAVYSSNSKNGETKWIQSYSNILETDKHGNSLLGLAVAIDIDDEIQKILDIQRLIGEQKNEILYLRLKKLSKAERKVLGFMKKGYSIKEIADTLCRSYYTIETHKKHIFKKLNIKSIPELLQVAHKFDVE
jgi:PAS domain S-box-containing protein